MVKSYLRLNYIFFVFCVFSLCFSDAAALHALDREKQLNQYFIISKDMESGLPTNAIYAIQQTRDGYLWLGTHDGLVRFDGIQPQFFSPGKNPQLSNPGKIRALYEDQNNILWIGTEAKGLINYKDGEFAPYTISGTNAFFKISSITQDNQGSLWVGSFQSGLACIAKGKDTVYTTGNGLPSNVVNSIYKDGKGNLWVTTSAGIVKIIKPGEFQTFPGAENVDFSKVYKVASLFEEDTGILWTGTGEGLFRLEAGESTGYSNVHGFPHLTVNTLFRDKKKNLWIGTDGGGLSRMSHGKLSTFPGDSPLAGSSVYALYEDRENSLWVGTLDKGLFQLREGKFTTYTAHEGLAHDDTQCIYQDQAGDLWFGTKGGLCLLSGDKITTVLTTANGLMDNSVTCLCEDRQNALWIGTWGGLHRRLKDGKLSSFTTRYDLPDNHINCILVDSRGITWVGTEDGLGRLDGNGGCRAYTTADGLPGKSVQMVFESSQDNLLIGTDRGLVEFRDGKIHPAAVVAGIKGCAYSCAYKDSRGVLWFGTNSGLVRAKTNHRPPFNFTIDHGLAENHVASILEDENGFLWLGGQNGISRIKKDLLEEFSPGKTPPLHPVRYTEADGMKSRWCNGQAIKTKDGKFWYPTVIGAAVIHPGQIQKQNAAPPLIIEKLTADGEPVYIHGQTKINQPRILPAGTKRLEFYYRVLPFINPNYITFKTKLSGYDQDWLDMGTTDKATYTGLTPGEYTFRVAAVNPEKPGEIWNRDIPALTIYKTPYITQTLGFYLLLIVTVGTVILFFHLLRVRRSRAREKHLEELVAERTRDLQERNLQLESARQKVQQSRDLIETKNLQLEAQTAQLKEQSERLKEMDRVKNRFFTNISHEFRTPLTLIMGPLEQMLSASGGATGEEQKRKLNLMLRNTQRLLGLINQLLELSRYESGKVKLRAGRRDIIPLLKGIVANFAPLAEQRELELRFQTGCDELFLYVEAAKLQEIMENLLINAMKFTPPGGRVMVEASCKPAKDPEKPGEFLQISISDTGPGIPREQLLHIFERFYQSNNTFEQRRQGTGVGLAIVKELVQLHHGTIDVYSHEGKGTEFIISLPMGDTHLQPEEIAGPGESPDKDAIPSSASTNSSTSTTSSAASESILQRYASMDTRNDQEHDGEEAEEKTGMEEFDPMKQEKEEKEIILVIEDSADMREFIRSELQASYTVLEAKDGNEGLQKAREIIPDLIISDIMMPGIDGLELCKTLKAGIETCHIPIILLTARASEPGIIEGLETGADDYITKPFSTRILAARIRNLIEIRRQFQLNLNREMVLQPVKESISLLDKEFLKALRGVIRKNIADVEFNVEKLAEELRMDRSTLYRKVLALTGETPNEFIRTCRLKRGAELLKSNFGTVLEVALEVGFGSANYFTKCFKKKFQQLPSEFQASEG